MIWRMYLRRVADMKTVHKEIYHGKQLKKAHNFSKKIRDGKPADNVAKRQPQGLIFNLTEQICT